VGLPRLSAQVPVLHEFIFVQAVPLHDVLERTRWKLALHNPAANFNRDFKVAVFSVKVRWRMVIPKHGDDDAQKSTYNWHGVNFLKPRNVTRNAFEYEAVVHGRKKRLGNDALGDCIF
jgi:tRNA G26 N,N-dimethylase Trm1